VYIYQKVFI